MDPRCVADDLILPEKPTLQLQPLGTSCGLLSEVYLHANDHSDGGDFHSDGDKKVVERRRRRRQKRTMRRITQPWQHRHNRATEMPCPKSLLDTRPLRRIPCKKGTLCWPCTVLHNQHTDTSR